MKNNQKGITLVALVITIIVLLILAGVTIAALSGNNGILNRAREAKFASDISTAKELVTLGVNECITDWYADKYVSNTSSISEGTIGAYVVAHIKDTQASSIIDTAKTTGTKIVTTVKDATGVALEGTIADDGKITWTAGEATTTD